MIDHTMSYPCSVTPILTLTWTGRLESSTVRCWREQAEISVGGRESRCGWVTCPDEWGDTLSGMDAKEDGLGTGEGVKGFECCWERVGFGVGVEVGVGTDK